MSASMTGLAKAHRLDGKQFDFSGESGKTYNVLSVGKLQVTRRYKGIESGHTVGDLVTIRTGEHTVEVSHDGVFVDGKAPLPEHYRPGDWVWVERQGVSVSAEGYLFGIILDDGGDNQVHHPGSPLEGVQHVSLFIDPPIPAGATGLLAEGTVGCDSSRFLVE